MVIKEIQIVDRRLKRMRMPRRGLEPLSLQIFATKTNAFELPITSYFCRSKLLTRYLLNINSQSTFSCCCCCLGVQ